MQRKEAKKINSLIQHFVKANKLEKDYGEYRLKKAWKEVLGVVVSNRTTDLQINGRTLIVKLSSSVVRNELSMMKDSLIPRLNEEAGMKVIDDIVFR